MCGGTEVAVTNEVQHEEFLYGCNEESNTVGNLLYITEELHSKNSKSV